MLEYDIKLEVNSEIFDKSKIILFSIKPNFPIKVIVKYIPCTKFLAYSIYQNYKIHRNLKKILWT